MREHTEDTVVTHIRDLFQQNLNAASLTFSLTDCTEEVIKNGLSLLGEDYAYWYKYTPQEKVFHVCVFRRVADILKLLLSFAQVSSQKNYERIYFDIELCEKINEWVFNHIEQKGAILIEKEDFCWSILNCLHCSKRHTAIISTVLSGKYVISEGYK